MTVYQRGRKTSAGISPVKDLTDIPRECVAEAEAFVEEANRRVGWDKYQLI